LGNWASTCPGRSLGPAALRLATPCRHSGSAAGSTRCSPAGGLDEIRLVICRRLPLRRHRRRRGPSLGSVGVLYVLCRRRVRKQAMRGLQLNLGLDWGLDLELDFRARLSRRVWDSRDFLRGQFGSPMRCVWRRVRMLGLRGLRVLVGTLGGIERVKIGFARG